MRATRAAEAAAASDRAGEARGRHRRQAASTRLPDSARVDGFIDGLAEALASLPGREPGRARRDGAGARLTAPRALTAAGDAILPRRLRQGARPAARILVVAIDPGLIAGLELETPHAVVRNSFRSDLARIVEELTRHDRVQH